MNESEMIFANGYSINYFRDDGSFDLFIIINEPNEYDDIDAAIKYLDSINVEKANMQELHNYLEEHFFGFGCELLIKETEVTYKKY